MKPLNRTLVLALALSGLAPAQKIEFTTVAQKPVSRTIELPAEIAPYLSVSLHAKVPGYVEKISVDRGSRVREGDLLAELSAPEMASRIAEAQSKVESAQSARLEAEARLQADQSTYARLKKAAETPGAIAEDELVRMRQQLEAEQNLAAARAQETRSAEANLKALHEIESYLRITAPFDGVVTTRLVHPGALVGPGNDTPLVVLEQVSRLRVVVAVPEEDAGAVAQGAQVQFHVPAFPDRAYSGTIARSAHSLDPKTRTLPVELDVQNPDGSLAPGMYASARWPVRAARAALVVPSSSVVTTSERTFVIRNHDGRAEWVDVRKGPIENGSVEVSGALKAGDQIVQRATDEIRDGSRFSEPRP